MEHKLCGWADGCHQNDIILFNLFKVKAHFKVYDPAVHQLGELNLAKSLPLSNVRREQLHTHLYAMSIKVAHISAICQYNIPTSISTLPQPH